MSKSVFHTKKLSAIYEKINKDITFKDKNTNRFVNEEFAENEHNEKIKNEIMIKNSKKRQIIKDFAIRGK